jgi:hypothetical protein
MRLKYAARRDDDFSGEQFKATHRLLSRLTFFRIAKSK